MPGWQARHNGEFLLEGAPIDLPGARIEDRKPGEVFGLGFGVPLLRRVAEGGVAQPVALLPFR